MSLKNKNESPSTSERSRVVTVGVATAAGAAAVAGVLSLHNFVGNTVEPDKAAASIDTSEQAHFEYVTDLSHDTQDQLLYIQASYSHDSTLSPATIPNMTLDQTGEQSFVIIDGAGGLAEQAEHAYETEHDGQVAPLSVQDSITVTTKALSQINHIKKQDDNIYKDENFTLIELKDSEGTDLVVVSPSTVDTD
ncbi:MAG: hypothetical protein JWO07_37 [Candidatus Saccharibacteria bacterium]|nr:hypothetical protein [Candidatus Saccharibacteria bacterium]